MADRSRAFLKQEFNDGERPTGADFADLIDSFINKEDDSVRLVNGNLSIPAGLSLSNATTGPDGTLRFAGSQVEVFQGGVWNPIGGSGAFTPVGGGPHVAFNGGNVGIGNFPTPPTHRLDVPLASNTGEADRARMGNLVVHNGQTNDAAYVSHRGATTDQNYALRQDAQANTTVNAGSGAQLVLSQQGTPRMRFTQTGALSITPQVSATIEANTAIGTPTTAANLNVFGNAFKPGGGPFQNLSDERVKRDVRPLDIGLDELRKLNPVFYKFNGVAGTPNDDREYVGMIAQEVARVVPLMVTESEPPTGATGEMPSLLTMDAGPLTYILVNALRQLADRVDQLEARLAELESEE